MTSTVAFSTSTSDRCDAQNQLTCRVHGVAGNFTEVPRIVQDNVDRAQSLREQSADAKSALHELAKEYGIAIPDIGYVTRGLAHANVSEEQAEALRLAEEEYEDALTEEDEENEYRAAQVRGYVNDAIKREFPDASDAERFNLSKLVGLRFFGVENEWFGTSGATVDEAYKHLSKNSATGEWDGPTREELFAPLTVPANRAKLREIDRGYFTALSGRIPTEEQLSEVAHQRRLRQMGSARDYMMDESFTLVTDLTSID